VITPPPGWTVERADEGLLLCPPEGAERALLRYVERRRPIRRAIDLAVAGPTPSGFVVETTSAPKRLVTAEGEYAALVTRTGTLAGRGYHLVYGYVFLDDYFSSLEGMCVPELVAAVEELVLGDVHLLGRVRRRRFNYSPPPGWVAEAGIFETRWLSPDAPANPAAIWVNPALPLVPGLVRNMLDKLDIAAQTPELFTTKHGLAAERFTHGDSYFWFASDQDFLYSVRGESAPYEGHALVDSIEPIPRVSQASGEGLQHWID
jgi:hypothetical protein